MAHARNGTDERVVVIAEDDEPIAVLLRDAIGDEPGYQAFVESDGARVLDTARRVGADLLILDIMMPGLNGFEIYDQLQLDADHGSTPVLFISAAVPHYAAEFQTRGVTDVIAKPFDLNDLLDRVRELCPLGD